MRYPEGAASVGMARMAVWKASGSAFVMAARPAFFDFSAVESGGIVASGSGRTFIAAGSIVWGDAGGSIVWADSVRCALFFLPVLRSRAQFSRPLRALPISSAGLLCERVPVSVGKA